MKNKKQDKQLKKLLFEVYDKGVKQQDCNLTEYIEKVKQALRIHDVVGRSEQLPESEKLCRMNQNFVCNCIDNSRCPNF